MNRPENFKYDVRVRDRMLASGSLSADELAAFLSDVPDRQGDYERLELEQPALMSDKVVPEETPMAGIVGLGVPALSAIEPAPPVNPMDPSSMGRVGMGHLGPAHKVSPFEPAPRVSALDPAPKVNPFEPAGPLSPYDPAPPMQHQPHQMSPYGQHPGASNPYGGGFNPYEAQQPSPFDLGRYPQQGGHQQGYPPQQHMGYNPQGYPPQQQHSPYGMPPPQSGHMPPQAPPQHYPPRGGYPQQGYPQQGPGGYDPNMGYPPPAPQYGQQPQHHHHNPYEQQHPTHNPYEQRGYPAHQGGGYGHPEQPQMPAPVDVPPYGSQQPGAGRPPMNVEPVGSNLGGPTGQPGPMVSPFEMSPQQQYSPNMPAISPFEPSRGAPPPHHDPNRGRGPQGGGGQGGGR